MGQCVGFCVWRWRCRSRRSCLKKKMREREKRKGDSIGVDTLITQRINTVETTPPVLAMCRNLTSMALFFCFHIHRQKIQPSFSIGVSTGYQTSLTLIPLGAASLPSPPLLDPTPKLATPLTSLLPTASTAPIGYAIISQHV